MARQKSGPLSLLFPCTAFITYRHLKREGTAATLNRLFTSNHVLDLKLIASATVFATIVAALIAAVLQSVTNKIDFGNNGWPTFISVAKVAEGYLIYVGPILAVFGVLIAWVYRQGSTRLGIVDLFAGEITTLCRVGTIMDLAKELAVDPDSRPRATASTAATEQGAAETFTSQEEYFPVFHNSAKDLQVLEAKVVIHITSFYTYMKVTRDLLRRLHQTPYFLSAGSKNENWETARCNTIYMLFLAFESARKAVRDLVEYQPEKAECTVTILLTEVTCYAFLLKHFGTNKNDIRYQRLDLRRVRYEETISRILGEVAKGTREAEAAVKNAKSDAKKAKAQDIEKDWQKAARLIGELMSRCNEVPEPALRVEALEPDQGFTFWFRLKKFVGSYASGEGRGRA